eukprot:scaffold9683_cov83-Cylindrotheca_fusiformis.AAC.2
MQTAKYPAEQQRKRSEIQERVSHILTRDVVKQCSISFNQQTIYSLAFVLLFFIVKITIRSISGKIGQIETK